jgi:hypothetical protein
MITQSAFDIQRREERKGKKEKNNLASLAALCEKI